MGPDKLVVIWGTSVVTARPSLGEVMGAPATFARSNEVDGIGPGVVLGYLARSERSLAMVCFRTNVCSTAYT